LGIALLVLLEFSQLPVLAAVVAAAVGAVVPFWIVQLTFMCKFAGVQNNVFDGFVEFAEALHATAH